MDMRQNIADKLQAQLAPAYLNVEDESHMHNVPSGAQSHFKVTVVAAEFSGQSLVNRHRRVNTGSWPRNWPGRCMHWPCTP